MPVGEELKALLFLDGLMVPFIGATVRNPTNGFPVASIDIYPTDTSRSILPRTLAHIFWKDPVDKVFKLIFEGEIWGRSFARSRSGRVNQIIAYSYDFHWHLAKNYYIDPTHSGSTGTGKMTQFINEEGGVEGIPFFAGLGPESSIETDIAKGSGSYLSKVIGACITALDERFKFYNLLSSRAKILSRITSATSDEIKSVFDETKAAKLLGSVARGGGGGPKTLFQTMANLLELVHHNFVSLAAPSYDGTKIKSLIFKPDSYITPPPRCNVIFPSGYSSFQYAHRFEAEPTRMQYSLPAEAAQLSGGATSLAKNMYAPRELASNLAEMSRKAEGLDADFTVKRDVYYSYLTFEEKFRGIVNAVQPEVPYLTQLLKEKDQIEKYAASYGSYYYYRQKYAARSFSITTNYDPWLIPGFNALVIDGSEARQHILAHVSMVEHRLHATQGATTMASFDTARELESFRWTQNMVYDKDLKKIVSDAIDEPSIPLWFDEKWGKTTTKKLSKIKEAAGIKNVTSDADITINDFPGIDEHYISLLGTQGGRSITTWENNSSTEGHTILESGLRVAQQYFLRESYGKVESWVNKFKRRDLPSITETFAFLGAATKQNPDGSIDGVRYTGAEYTRQFQKDSTFDGVDATDKQIIALRRSVIEAYRTELIKKKGFGG